MRVLVAGGGSAPERLLEAFAAYERALMADDLAAMDALFAPGPATLRGDRDGLLVGHDAIAEFRQFRGGAPRRTLGDVHVQVIDDDAALVVAVTLAARGGRGVQTQLWRRLEGAWRVAAAQVGPPPQTFDATVWRAVGAPLVAATGDGPLTSETVAVKDVYAVAGFSIGAGVPEHRASEPVQSEHAAAVSRLLEAGAAVVGIAQTDQFAYSIAGTNEHSGAPVNPAVTGAVPGGSSSGSAVAVSLGAASIGLGTDTAGSIRVPASYQGLWGLRTTHGSVPTAGLLPLAPDFDTVGLLTRGPELLERAARVLVGEGSVAVGSLVTDPVVTALAQPEVAAVVGGFADEREADRIAIGVDLDEAYEAFRVHQAYQAWQTHGAWITAHPDAVIGAAGERFAIASRVTASEEAAAVATVARFRAALDDALGESVLVLPSTSSAAPSLTSSGVTVDAIRAATLRLTCLAGITGRPALSIPGGVVDGAPVGVCLIGPRGSDLALLRFHRGFARSEISPRIRRFCGLTADLPLLCFHR